MDITLRQLRYFVALAENGSFGAAARAVHVSQPALSLQIKELETRLDARLVDRLPQGVHLTRAGRDILERARRILAETRDLERAARWRHGLAGQLSLGAIPTVAPYLLPVTLMRLRQADTALDIRIREAHTESLLDSLAAGALDAAIVALPVSGSRLAADPLFQDRFVLAGSAGRLEALSRAPEGLRPERIDPDQLLLLEEGHCLADQALEVCGLPARRKVDLGAASLATLSGLVAGGLGLTLLPELALKTECAGAPDLKLARFAAPEPARTIGLVHRGGRSEKGWVEDLGALLAEAGSSLIAHARAAFPA